MPTRLITYQNIQPSIVPANQPTNPSTHKPTNPPVHQNAGLSANQPAHPRTQQHGIIECKNTQVECVGGQGVTRTLNKMACFAFFPSPPAQFYQPTSTPAHQLTSLAANQPNHQPSSQPASPSKKYGIIEIEWKTTEIECVALLVVKIYERQTNSMFCFFPSPPAHQPINLQVHQPSSQPACQPAKIPTQHPTRLAANQRTIPLTCQPIWHYENQK